MQRKLIQNSQLKQLIWLKTCQKLSKKVSFAWKVMIKWKMFSKTALTTNKSVRKKKSRDRRLAMDTSVKYYSMIEITMAKTVKMGSIITTIISSSRCKVLVKGHIAIEVHKMTIIILDEVQETIRDTTITKIKIPIIIEVMTSRNSNSIQMVEVKEMIKIATTIPEINTIITAEVAIIRTINKTIMATIIITVSTTTEVVKITITTIMIDKTTATPLEVKIITGRTTTMISSLPFQAKDRNIEDDFIKSHQELSICLQFQFQLMNSFIKDNMFYFLFISFLFQFNISSQRDCHSVQIKIWK